MLNEALEFCFSLDGSHRIVSGCSEVSSHTFYIFALSAGSSSPCIDIFLVDV